MPLLVLGQEKKSKGYSSKKVRTITSQELLDQAKALSDQSPKEAIYLIEQIITTKKDKFSYLLFDDAYVLLGKIYEDIDQLDLATQRYTQALSHTSKNDEDQKALIFYRLGRISIKSKNVKLAESYFTKCLSIVVDDQLLRRCEVGKIDVLILKNQNQEALTALDGMLQNSGSDSLTVVQIESRKSQAYSQIFDYKNAASSIQQVYNTIPVNANLSDEDIEPLSIAQDKLFLNANLTNTKKIEIQDNLDYNKRNFNSNIAKEKLRISKTYEEENDYEGFKDAIETSKKYINESTDASLVADIYKKSYEYNIKRGSSEKAKLDLDKYVQAKELALVDLENNLKDQIEIVKSQKRIDISQSDIALQEKERDLMESQLNTQKILIGLLSLLVLASLIFFYFLNRSIKEKKRANQLLELKSLRTQMNPHFIFNALNSVNNFIAKNDEKSANKYLSEFSQLMRMVLDYSKRNFISLREELELNELYLKLEHFRFRDKFDYTFEDNIEATNLDLEVPPMLIQPFIENAVWHGLRYKEDKGHLSIVFAKQKENIIVTITDDGIGRDKSKSLKTKNQKNHKSTGLSNVQNRLEILNKTYDKAFQVEIKDGNTNSKDIGTVVIITLPITN